jgi:hypothetical protein
VFSLSCGSPCDTWATLVGKMVDCCFHFDCCFKKMGNGHDINDGCCGTLVCVGIAIMLACSLWTRALMGIDV